MLCIATLLSSIGLTVFGPASPAQADPGCVNGGVYVLFARGSGERFNDWRANQFYWSLIGAAHDPGVLYGKVSTAWAELGNLDGQPGPDGKANNPGEYPAVSWDYYSQGGLNFDGYGVSVAVGTKELIAHLNDRASRCPTESVVLGGYSQGADVIGWALERSGYGSLSQAARDRIGYVALFGDPRFDPGPLWQRQSYWRPWWVRGDDTGFRYRGAPWNDVVPNSGILTPRTPPNEYYGRVGSWCAYRDGICSGIFPSGMDVHSNAYQGDNGWIENAAPEIASKVIQKRNALNPGSPQVPVPSFTITNDNTGPEPTEPPKPVVQWVKRTTDPNGVRQVYAATRSAITEAWWRPNTDGVHASEIIHISQDNIVGFDKVNLPDGKQAVYTAVPDGVWETWWEPGGGLHHNKIITGLSGVSQVIADNVTENGQYTHRLYILAQDGPYEAWWRDGGDGIHLTRLANINGPVTFTKSTGPDGADQLYVATPTWVYEVWWFPGASVHTGTIINITQGDIRSLSKDANQPNGGQRLYTTTSTTVWESSWGGGASNISHHARVVSQTNAQMSEKMMSGTTNQLYVATGNRVQEYWWHSTNSGGSTLIDITQNNIKAFDKSNDGTDQQVYTTSGDLVYETWWRSGVSPTSSVLFKVRR